MSQYPYDEYYDEDDRCWCYDCDNWCEDCYCDWEFDEDDVDLEAVRAVRLDDLPGLNYGTFGDADDLDDIPF